MLLAKKTFIYLFYVLGAFGIWSTTIDFIGGNLDNPVTSMGLSASLIAVGFLTQKGIEWQYKGGASTVIGILFIFFGLFAIFNSADEYFVSGTSRPAEHYGVTLFFLIVGFVLVYSGHNHHKAVIALRKTQSGNPTE